jgi:hypothetical protein
LLDIVRLGDYICAFNVTNGHSSVNPFVQRRSGFSLLLAWVFLASFFADSANLDDLFSSNYVIHDDDELCSDASSSIPQDRYPGVPQPSKVPEKKVLVVVDQDSPALASDPLGPPSTIVSLFALDEQVTVANFCSADPFYLLNCTLLI